MGTPQRATEAAVQVERVTDGPVAVELMGQVFDFETGREVAATADAVRSVYRDNQGVERYEGSHAVLNPDKSLDQAYQHARNWAF